MAHRTAFAERLRELKDRSGRSYQALGRRCGLSSSTVHRYCSGAGVPVEFAPIERLARACGADRAELTELHRLWAFAHVRREIQQEAPVEVAPEPKPRRDWRWVAAAVALLLTFALATASGPAPEPAPLGQQIPMWTDRPIDVGAAFVGVTKNATSSAMPRFGVGSVRLWNSGTRWEKLEPERGKFEWFRLDRLVDPANAAGVPVLFTLGGTPGWASPNGPETVFGDGSRTAPPDDLAEWDRFVRVLADRYRGRIAAYELWDTANDPRGYSGSVETMVEMTALAARAIKAADPAATVVCPGMAELWEVARREWLEAFARLGGYRHCDVRGVKLHPRASADPPERMVELATEIERVLYRARAPELPMWNMGQGFATGEEPRVPADLAADHAVRFYLVSLYAEYRRAYFYNWGSDRIPIVLQPSGGQPTRAARHVEELSAWLTGARNTFCGHGSNVGVPDHVWRCGFVKDSREFQIMWTDGIPVRVDLHARVDLIDGASGTTTADGALELTGRPVVLRT